MNNDVVDLEKHITRLWSKGGYGHYTKREDMYFEFLNRLLPQFVGGSVLEVGPGTGRFAEMMMERFEISSYAILDIETQIGDSMKRLAGKMCEFVVSQDYQSLFGRSFDLFVSNICLPETPGYYRDALAKGVFPNCEAAFVIGGDAKDAGDDYARWVRDVFDKNFQLVSEEQTGYCNTFAIAGSKTEG